MSRVAKEKGVEIFNLTIRPDHLHLFVSAYPKLLTYKLIRTFKGRSSNILRESSLELLKLPSLWTHSCLVNTAGNVSAETI